MTSPGRLPVWDRLRAPDSRPLVVRPLQRVERDLLRISDGDLPDVGGSTVFDARPTTDGYALRAAAVDDVVVTPYAVRARRLEIDGSDGRLEALLGERRPVAAHGELERMACACRGISVDAVYRAVSSGWRTADMVKRATRLSFGVCQGRRCVPWLAERLELEPADPLAQIRPRPPLVPVPASVLAAFVEPAV